MCMCVSWDVYVERCHLVTRAVTSIPASVAYRYFHIMKKIAVTQMTPGAHMRVPLFVVRLSVHPSPVSCASPPAVLTYTLSSPTHPALTRPPGTHTPHTRPCPPFRIPSSFLWVIGLQLSPANLSLSFAYSSAKRSLE